MTRTAAQNNLRAVVRAAGQHEGMKKVQITATRPRSLSCRWRVAALVVSHAAQEHQAGEVARAAPLIGCVLQGAVALVFGKPQRNGLVVQQRGRSVHPGGGRSCGGHVVFGIDWLQRRTHYARNSVCFNR